jgi:hypothetical protein
MIAPPPPRLRQQAGRNRGCGRRRRHVRTCDRGAPMAEIVAPRHPGGHPGRTPPVAGDRSAGFSDGAACGVAAKPRRAGCGVFERTCIVRDDGTRGDPRDGGVRFRARVGRLVCREREGRPWSRGARRDPISPGGTGTVRRMGAERSRHPHRPAMDHVNPARPLQIREARHVCSATTSSPTRRFNCRRESRTADLWRAPWPCTVVPPPVKPEVPERRPLAGSDIRLASLLRNPCGARPPPGSSGHPRWSICEQESRWAPRCSWI